MFARIAFGPVLAAAFLFLSGCGPAKLNESRSYNLDPGAAEGFALPAQSKAQKLTIEFSAPEEVTVLLFKEADAPDDEMPFASEKNALGFKKGKAETFTVDVPENTPTKFVVRGAAKTTKVDVKVTNRE